MGKTMDPENAKRLLGWWAHGADVGSDTLREAINVLVKGKPNKFVEKCIHEREILETKLRHQALAPKNP
jgi:hypothetical protein